MTIRDDTVRDHFVYVTPPAVRVILAGLHGEANFKELPKPDASEVIFCARKTITIWFRVYATDLP